ncbi:TniQ family protein [Paraburkholderia kururiensis]|uniref:TniQ family protein n=1 Tax=Paraburkholderia kururiensis TaxID=984307 RepID=UPI000F88444E|nr:TniQ family protein [Paraburkholderia kururiensis]
MSYAISNPRSTLRALAPIGVGTPEVESLLGYFCRLAVSHSVSVAALCRQVTKAVGWELAEKYTWHVGNIDSIGDSANNWSAALSAWTGVEQLDKLTLLSWRDVVCPTSGSMQGHGPSLVEGGRRSARARRPRGPATTKKPALRPVFLRPFASARCVQNSSVYHRFPIKQNASHRGIKHNVSRWPLYA